MPKHKDWTAASILETMRQGVRVAYIPKSVLYNEVRGEDCRFLCIGREIFPDCGPTDDITSLEQQKLIRPVELRSGVRKYVLTPKGKET
jgi:hypothetical protein